MVKLLRYILLSFDPYVKQQDIYQIIDKLREHVEVNLVNLWRKRALIKVLNVEEAVNILRDISNISKIIFIDSIIMNKSINSISNVILDLIKKQFSGKRTFKVETRRWDKSYPLTSLDVNKYLGEKIRNLGLEVDLKNPEIILFVGIDKSKIFIGHYYMEFVKVKTAISKEVTESICAVIEKPQIIYEIMDLIQASRSFNINIKLLGNSKTARLFKQALNNLSLPFDQAKISIINEKDLVDLIKNSDCTIALTPYAKNNEELLTKLVLKHNKIILLLGNEYEDLSINLRKMANYEIRLGPLTQQPMRTTIALAYTLGIIFSIKAGYLTPKK